MLAVLRWLLPSVVPALALLVLLWRTDRNREPPLVVLGTYGLGILFGAAAFWVTGKARTAMGLDLSIHAAGQAGALAFVFAIYSPFGEFAKVAATWPAFRSRYFDEPFDGVVYAGSAALGFATLESARILLRHPTGGVWIARALLALPAHLFFAALWGWGLGRAKRSREPSKAFPTLFVVAVIGHGFYTHLIYGRGAGAMLAVIPMLLGMAVVAFFVGRDLRKRNTLDRQSSVTRLSMVGLEAAARPSIQAFREALRRRERPLMIRWVVMAVFVTFGAMVLGLAASVALGFFAHVDFSVVDERDVSASAPVALFVAGLLAAFPLSGYLIARAASLRGIAEPAAGSAIAILATLVLLGLVAPVALVFALALAPIAFGLSCLGALFGRA